MILLEARDLIKIYGGRAVVNHVSVVVNQGEIVGLLGRNGAGKTTTFRMTIGMISPNGGTVIFDGMDVTRVPMYKRARRGMGYLSQEPSIFQRLTVRENLQAILETMNLSKAVRNEKCHQLLEQFGLTRQAEQLALTWTTRTRRPRRRSKPTITSRNRACDSN